VDVLRYVGKSGKRHCSCIFNFVFALILRMKIEKKKEKREKKKKDNEVDILRWTYYDMLENLANIFVVVSFFFIANQK
jgi:hypothetical protein